jgi:hypothetical protein
VQENGNSIVVDGEQDLRYACIKVTFTVFCYPTRNPLSFHLNSPIWISRLAVKETTDPIGVPESVLGPKIGKEEGNRTFEIVSVYEESPTISSRGDIFAVGFFFRFGEGKVEVTVAE